MDKKFSPHYESVIRITLTQTVKNDFSFANTYINFLIRDLCLILTLTGKNVEYQA